MEFRKFESIENTYVKSNISRIIFNNYNTGEWIVTEKLHGANFAVYVKGLKVVKFASRNQFVDGTFYKSEELQQKIIKRVDIVSFEEEKEDPDNLINLEGYRNRDLKLIEQYLSENNIDIHNESTEIIFYGELVGDRVQKEVRYNKDLEFFVFDVVINGKAINKEIAFLLAHRFNLSVVPQRKKGTFEECCEVENSFNSSLSYRCDNDYFKICMTDDGFAMYDVSTGILLEDGLNNEAEGIIIEPINPMFFDNGKRILLKNKTRKFSEKNDGLVKTDVKELSEKDNEILSKLLPYINNNRLNAVKSKGHSEKAVPFMMTKDILEDYSKENNDIDLRKSSDNFKLLTYTLQIEINKFISGE